MFGVTPSVAPVHSDAEIETVISGVGREPGSGLLAMPDNFLTIHRAQIISLAARNNVVVSHNLVRDSRIAAGSPGSDRL